MYRHKLDALAVVGFRMSCNETPSEMKYTLEQVKVMELPTACDNIKTKRYIAKYGNAMLIYASIPPSLFVHRKAVRQRTTRIREMLYQSGFALDKEAYYQGRLIQAFYRIVSF